MSQIYGIDFTTAPSQNPLSDSGAWTTVSGALQVANGYCQGTGGDAPGNGGGESALTGPTLPHDQYAQYKLGTLSSSSFVSMLVRAASNLGATNGRFTFKILGSGSWTLSEVISGTGTLVASGSTTVNPNDVFTLTAQGTAITVYQNGVQLTSYTDLNSGTDVFQGLLINADAEGFVGTVLSYQAGTGNPFTSSISGNAGVAGATVNYTGTSSGTVTADGSGNYSINGLTNGNYTVTPSKTGYVFSPASLSESVSGNITNANFTASNYYSAPDCRVAPFGPNSGVTNQGTILYTGQTSSNPAVPGTDSRAAGAPVDSRASQPTNSRTPGTYGPGE